MVDVEFDVLLFEVNDALVVETDVVASVLDVVVFSPAIEDVWFVVSGLVES